MREDAKQIIASYRQSVAFAYLTAIDLYGCTGCAADAVLSLFRVVGEELESGPACDGVGVCGDLALLAKRVLGAATGEAVSRVRGKRSIELTVQLATDVKDTWLILSELVGCNECLNVMVCCDIRKAQEEINERIVGKVGGLVAACRDCRALPIGLI